MESLFNLPRPLQRRLTKMYTDTKSSYDFVKEPIQVAEDPELMSLHRKLRIQKDRLVSWGLEWSDPSQSPDIDESINKAGLSELVGSVMSTIKEILAEAEPLWQSSSRSYMERSPVSEKAVDRKPSLIVWDQSRFEDLVRDLTMSIETLYDLSRTRQNAQKTSLKSSESGSIVESPAPEEKQFESSRMQTPQQIDPASLIWPRDLKGVLPGTLQPAKSPRQIVFMRRPTSLADARHTGLESTQIVPVLLEHARYDPIYSTTGISPSMTRFERLFAALSQAHISSDRIFSGLLRLIGYFEEAEYSRFCLLYALPTHFGPVDIRSPKVPTITILSELLHSKSNEPSLEIKYRLAYNVANSVFDLHAKGAMHGNVLSTNVLFIENEPQQQFGLAKVNMRQSYLASFDLFSDNATDVPEPPTPSWRILHRHPLDPRTTRYTRLTPESKSLDLYSLAMLLLEIGLWTSLPEIFPGVSAIPQNPVDVFKRLATKCGSLFVKAVRACWNAPDEELSSRARPDVMHQKVFLKVSKALDACCAIDEVSDEEEQSDDSPLIASRTLQHSRPTISRKQTPEFNASAFPSVMFKPTHVGWPEKPPLNKASGSMDKADWSEKPLVKSTTPISHVQRSKPKLRTYPSIRISQEHLNFWHTDLIPRINHALRGFYRKYPESVEVSLESIGESASTTKPTILVICTSVNKVRSILKQSLVYDKSVYGLKVCRGKVMRSRKPRARRSMANEPGDFVKAANGDHQERPSNGASIGAYVGDHHLAAVSFGGLIMVDGKPYGMTVHHMLDDPDAEEEEEEESGFQEPILRSSARITDVPELTRSESSIYSSGDEEYMYALSDYDSDASLAEESESEGEYDGDLSEDEGEDYLEPGDVMGVPQGQGEGYIITQPAIDDVDEDFYPSEETRDEDHLDSCSLGELYASSGIRRRVEDGTVHEIDWALFEFNPERCPAKNCITSGKRFGPQREQYPVTVVPNSDLSNLDVHCMARTSGLQSGRILPGMVIVKIYGRQTPSSSYQVVGKLGVPGDSGAWVVDNEHGRACGHVLAWSNRKKAAYICPMDVLLRDIGETLKAESVCFPGGPEVYPTAPQQTAVQPQAQIVDLLRDFQIAPSTAEADMARSPEDVERSEAPPSYVPITLMESQDGLGKASRGQSMDFMTSKTGHWNMHVGSIIQPPDASGPAGVYPV